MQYKDEFDGPGYGSHVRGALASIFKALERKERVPQRRPVWAAAVVLSLVAFLASVLWYSYPREMEKRKIMAVPIIRADAGPAKVRRLRKKASAMGLNPNVWFGNVEIAAAKVIGRETVQYVGNIYKYYIAYKMITEQEERKLKIKKAKSQ